MLPQTRMIPVKTYRHTDSSAPVLTGTKGALKTLLKACLVEGYGTAAPLGWEMPFEDTHRAAFRSKDATSNKHYVYIDHNAATHAVRVRAAASMTALDARVDEFAVAASNMTDLTAIAYSDKTTPWILIGHEKAFILLMENTYNKIHGSFVYFGDVPSFVAGDVFNTVLWRFSAYNNQFNQSNSFPLSNNICFARHYNAVTVGAPSTICCATEAGGGGTYFNHLGNYSAQTNQILAAPAYLCQDEIIRAPFPGIYIPTVRLPAGLTDCPFAGFEDYVQARVGEQGSAGSSILVNKKAWAGL